MIAWLQAGLCIPQHQQILMLDHQPQSWNMNQIMSSKARTCKQTRTCQLKPNEMTKHSKLSDQRKQNNQTKQTKQIKPTKQNKLNNLNKPNKTKKQPKSSTTTFCFKKRQLVPPTPRLVQRAWRCRLGCGVGGWVRDGQE